MIHVTEIERTESGKKLRFTFGKPIPWTQAKEASCTMGPLYAKDFLAKNGDSIREITLQEVGKKGLLNTTARWLEAECPHCKKQQTLLHSNWIYVPEWECEDNNPIVLSPEDKTRFHPYDGEIPLPDELDFFSLEHGCKIEPSHCGGRFGAIGPNPRNGRYDAIEPSHCDDQRGAHVSLETDASIIPSTHIRSSKPSFSQIEKPQLTMPYGSEAPAASALHELQQEHLKFEGLPFEKTFGNSEKFVGTYLCPECGKAFSTWHGDFPEPNNDLISELSRLYDYWNMLRDDVIVETSDKSLTISGYGAENVKLNFETGSTRVYGSDLFAGSFGDMRSLEDFLWILEEDFYFFEDHEFFSRICELLPKSLHLEVRWLPRSYRRWSSRTRTPINQSKQIPHETPPRLWGLILHNRFRGYPEDFYESFCRDESMKLENLWYINQLPRNYRDLDAIWPKTGLPNEKSLGHLSDRLLRAAHVDNGWH